MSFVRANVPFYLLILFVVISCGKDTKELLTEERGLQVVPGLSLGDVSLGMSLSQLTEALGEPEKSFSFNRLVTYQYTTLGMEVMLTSSDANAASIDARVVALGTLSGTKVEGEVWTGMTMDELEALYGAPYIQEGKIAYFTDIGLGAKCDDEGRVILFTVWPGYDSQPQPPEMIQAATTVPTDVDRAITGEPIRYEIDGELFEVVDMHLHVGKASGQTPDGVGFLVSQLPGPAALYFPATSGEVIHPYSDHLGIQEHLKAAGVSHGVILSTYTHHTIGYAENRLVEAFLDDPRNVNPDGTQWAWGLASINFEGFEEPGVAQKRLDALNSYLENRPDLFIGIKLAHAHQAVRFDDPIYLGVYDVAAKNQVPVLLHTGFSPFPHSMVEPEFYDPSSLENVIQDYDGTHGKGRVDFILGHSGQGDARAIESSLQLAAEYDNVWLEISAIHRPLLLDMYGNLVDDNSPMHPYVLGEIKKRGLVHRTIYATDGPQYFGKSQSYLKMMVKAMKKADYTVEDLRAVLAENFYDCFQLDSSLF